MPVELHGDLQRRRSSDLLPCPVSATLNHVNSRPDPQLKLHGEALLTAKRPELEPLIDHLREAAQGRDDIRVECAGTIAGSWFSSGARRSEELIAAGLLGLAGPVDLDELDRWMRIGWERRRGADIPFGQGFSGT
jgi:hypothetical protein